MSDADSAYAERLQREGKKWGDHLAVEAGQEMYAWLDHPSIHAHYEERSRVEGRRGVAGSPSASTDPRSGAWSSGAGREP